MPENNKKLDIPTSFLHSVAHAPSFLGFSFSSSQGK